MAVLEDLNIEDVGFNNKYSKEQQKLINHFKELNGDFLPSCFEDVDFLNVFMEYVDEENWDSYLTNTMKLLNEDKTLDPKFALMFRRTTLAAEPKREVFWTNEYGVVRNGLKKEIPEHSEHRILSKIFVTTLEELDKFKQTAEDSSAIEKEYGDGSSDGEVRISSKPFDLRKNCLFAIKPENEMKEYLEYKQKQNLEQE